MSIHFGSPLFLSLVGFGTFALWETLAPDRRRLLSRVLRWPSNFSLVVFAHLGLLVWPITVLVSASWSQTQSFGLLHQRPLNHFVLGLVSLILLDFSLWVQHLVSHKVAWLWRLHRVHHTDPDLDVSSAARFHPFEILLSQIWMSGAVVTFGVSPQWVGLHALLVGTFAQFNHANIRLPLPLDFALRQFIATPAFHRIHHSVLPQEANSNYGNILSIWDTLFGTRTNFPQSDQDRLRLGVVGWRNALAQRADKLLFQPFARNPIK